MFPHRRAIIGLFLPLLAWCLPQAHAQLDQYIGKHFRAQVTNIVSEQRIEQGEGEFYVQEVEVKRLDTQEITHLTVGSEFQPLNQAQKVQVGKTLILAEQTLTTGETQLVVVDVFRIPMVLWLFGLFVVSVLVIGRWQGALSLVGMFASVGILLNYLVPQIIAGQNPLLISLLGCGVIGAVTLYLSHGWSVKSHIAFASILLTLTVVAILAFVSVKTAQLVGLGSEEAYFLQFGQTAKINLQGLLLGGILLGALGVLDDITVSQVSVVAQLKAVKKDITFKELYLRSLIVGRDHVASLTNTLVLAYAGANLPLFVLFKLNQQVPAWVTLNSEMIIEEVIRTLAGSIGLVLAVPLTTALAVFVIQKYKNASLSTPTDHVHHH